MDSNIISLIKQADDLRKQISDTKESLKDCSIDEYSNVTKPIHLSIKHEYSLRGHLAKINSLATNGPRNLLTASQDGKLIIWDIPSYHKIYAIPLESSWVMACAYSPSGNYVACGGLDSIVYIYALKTTDRVVKLVSRLIHHSGYISSLKFIDDTYILTASGDTTCALFDFIQSKLLKTFVFHKDDVTCIDSNQVNQDVFAASSCDKMISQFDKRINHVVQTFESHKGDVNSLKFFPNGHAIGSVSDDSSCLIHELRCQQKICELNKQLESSLNALSFSKSGAVVFVASRFNICYFDVIKKEFLGRLTGHENRVNATEINSTGSKLLTASSDCTARIWQ